MYCAPYKVIHCQFDSVEENHLGVNNVSILIAAQINMAFFATIGVVVFFYYLISAILWLVRDSDVELFYKEKYGKSISKYSFGAAMLLRPRLCNRGSPIAHFCVRQSI